MVKSKFLWGKHNVVLAEIMEECNMTVAERLAKLKQDNFMVIHKAIGEEMLLSDDWVRIRSHNWEFYHACDRINAHHIPNELLSREVLNEEVWLIGGNMALDLIIS